MERHRDRLLPRDQDRASGTTRARATEIRRSLERLRVDHVDLLQLHNLVKEDEWEMALGPDGALARRGRGARRRARALHRRHGPRHARRRDAPAQPRALRLRLGAPALQPDDDARRRTTPRDFERAARALRRARRRRADDQVDRARAAGPTAATPTHATWYEPLTDPADIERAVHWALARPGVFVNTAGDLRLLAPMLRAARELRGAPRRRRAPPPGAPGPRAALRAGLRGLTRSSLPLV